MMTVNLHVVGVDILVINIEHRKIWGIAFNESIDELYIVKMYKKRSKTKRKIVQHHQIQTINSNTKEFIQ
jgi:hypothetical protein